MQTSQLKLTDTHCHLYAAEFDPDREEMITRAVDAGIYRMMVPNIDMSSIPAMTDLTGQFPDNCFAMMGLHPCSVREDYREILYLMKEELDRNAYIGIGETGVDLYWDTSHKDIQIEAFEQQIAWAREYKLPVIIHSRESLDLNIDIISNQQDGSLKGIFHCFGGSPEQAAQIEELGFKIGIGGIVTFKNAQLNETLKNVSSRIIVLETDAPYLSPVPHRGKRNEPFYLTLIADKVAQILGLSLAELAELTNSNASEVFDKKG